MTPKPFYTSKVFWFNTITVLVTVATVFGYTPDQQLAKQVTAGLVAVSPIINLLLRFVTKQPLL